MGMAITTNQIPQNPTTPLPISPWSVLSLSPPSETPMAIPPSSLATQMGSGAGAAGAAQSSDSERGKACHQCRQMKYSCIATCKNVQAGKKPYMCSIVICRKCLLNRYGEKVEEVADVDGWCCPRCRGICNCSKCMKKKGHQPTGLLTQTAKSNGFSSVMEMLNRKGLKCMNEENPVRSAHAVLGKPDISTKIMKRKLVKDIYTQDEDLNQEKEDYFGGNDDKENICIKIETQSPSKKVKHVHWEYNVKDGKNVNNSGVIHNENNLKNRDKAEDGGILHRGSNLKDGNKVGYNDADAQAKPLQKVVKPRKYVLRNVNECIDSYTALPQGTSLTVVGGVELSEQNIGPALQFLEFCSAFAKILDIKKGQPEAILRELTRGLGRRGLNSTLVQLHVKLLSLLYNDSGKTSLRCTAKNGNSWLQALQACFTESEHSPKKVPLDFVSEGITGYDNLDPFQKLSILNFLCDEILNTEALRSWIDKENTKYDQRKKEARERALIEKEKEKCLKQQVKVDGTHAMLSLKDGSLVSVSKHDNSPSEINCLTKKSHLEIAYRKHTSDAVRTESILLDGIGRVFWRLKSHFKSSGIMLQDVNRDLIASQDKWFIYNDDEEKEVEKHISFVRNLRSRRYRSLKTKVSEIKNEGIDNHVI